MPASRYTLPKLAIFLTIFILWLLTFQVFANPLTVMEVTERTYDNGPALAIVFSESLDPTQHYDAFLSVSNNKQGHVEGAWIVGDNPHILFFPQILPETEYTVNILGGLMAGNGQKLPAFLSKKVKTQPLPPAFGFASQGLILPAELTGGLPIISVNVEAVDLEFFRVQPDKVADFIKDFQRSSAKSHWELENLHTLADSVYLGRFNTNAQPNKRTVSHIPVENIAELKSPGLYIAVMRAPGQYQNDYQTAYFFVSDIGLHARRYAKRFEIYAASLRTGKPLPNVEVNLYIETTDKVKNGLFAKSYTDPQGRTFFETLPDDARLLTAQYDNHVSFLFLTDPALDLSEFEISGQRAQPLEIFVYGPRDLYRPGETVHFSALLRDEDGRQVVTPPLQAKLKRPDGREVHNFVWQPQTLGYYSKTFDLPRDAQTGGWTLEVYADPTDKTPTQVYHFKVEEFLPERLKLTLNSPQLYLKPKEDFQIQVEGLYLYGAPAANNRITASLHVRPHQHPVENMVDFYFGREDGPRNYREDFSDQTLNDQGQFTLTAQPFEKEGKDTIAPLEVKVVVSLYETGGRPVTRAIQRILWPATELVGIRPLFDLQNAASGGTVQFEVVKVNQAGKLVAAPELQVQLIHEDRDYYWNYSHQSGWKMEYREAEYPEQRLSLAIASGERAKLAFPIQNGRYRVEILDPSTKLTTTLRFHSGWYGDEDTKGAARPDKVTLHLDKAAYRAGDTIKLKVLPPHAGEGLILVESRDQPLWATQQLITAEGSVVEIPVAANWNQHDLYISAIVLRPGLAKDKITPNRAVGIIHLPLDRTDRTFALQLQTPAKILPETPLTVKIKADNLQNQEVLVTVAAVDVGILNLTDFATPDPYSYFFAKRSYSIDMYDLYGQVIENLEGVKAKLRFGGDAAGSGSKRPDAKIKLVSLFSGPVKLNAQGQAEVSLPIPDFNGRLRVMALAFTADRFAKADTEVTVAAPLVAEIATPRFLASGDKSMLTIDLHNLSGTDQFLKLKVSATPPLLLDELGMPLTLHNQDKTTLRLFLRGGDFFGVGQIKLAVQGQGVALQRQWELGVRPAYPGERRVSREILTAGQTLTIDPHLADDLMSKTVDVDLVAAIEPPLNLRSALKYLLQYPYGCLEQTTSSAYPLIYANQNIAKQLELEPLSDQERQKRLEVAFTRLASMQKANGGFGLWDSQDLEENWLTPYVLNFLLDAQEQGFAIPDQMLQRGLKRLLERLPANEEGFAIKYQDSGQNKHATIAAKAFASYVLARLGRAPLGTLRTLYDQSLKEAKSPLPLAHLGLALYLQGDQKRGLTALNQALTQKNVQASGYNGDYGSHLRDLAMMIHLIHKHHLDLAGHETLWLELDQVLRNDHWHSTQERNALFLAGLSILSQRTKTGRQAILTIGEATQTIKFQNRWQHRFSVDELRAGIHLQSPETLYTELEISGYGLQPPAEDQRQVSLSRQFYTLEGKPVKDRPLQVGELLLGYLTLKSTSYIDNGLLIDLLPAGLELENTNLMHSANLEDFEIDGIKMQEALKQEADKLKHQEFRDDRLVAALRLPANQLTRLFYLIRVVTPGIYTLPSPYFEDMYRPTIRAFGKGGGTLQVESHHKE